MRYMEIGELVHVSGGNGTTAPSSTTSGTSTTLTCPGGTSSVVMTNSRTNDVLVTCVQDPAPCVDIGQVCTQP